MKRLLIILIGITLLLSACGSDSNEEEEPKQEGETTQEDVNNEVDEKTSDETSGGVDDSESEIEIFSDEVKRFIDEYNNLASLEEGIGLIKEVEPASEMESGYSQTLFSSSEYVISTLYDKEGNVESYIVVIPASEPYQELKGNGLYATLHVGAALDLDVEVLASEFEKALPNHAGIYFADDYTVTFSTNDDVPEIGMITMFMNLGFSE